MDGQEDLGRLWFGPAGAIESAVKRLPPRDCRGREADALAGLAKPSAALLCPAVPTDVEVTRAVDQNEAALYAAVGNKNKPGLKEWRSEELSYRWIVFVSYSRSSPKR